MPRPSNVLLTFVLASGFAPIVTVAQTLAEAPPVQPTTSRYSLNENQPANKYPILFTVQQQARAAVDASLNDFLDALKKSPESIDENKRLRIKDELIKLCRTNDSILACGLATPDADLPDSFFESKDFQDYAAIVQGTTESQPRDSLVFLGERIRQEVLDYDAFSEKLADKASLPLIKAFATDARDIALAAKNITQIITGDDRDAKEDKQNPAQSNDNINDLYTATSVVDTKPGPGDDTPASEDAPHLQRLQYLAYDAFNNSVGKARDSLLIAKESKDYSALEKAKKINNLFWGLCRQGYPSKCGDPQKRQSLSAEFHLDNTDDPDVDSETHRHILDTVLDRTEAILLDIANDNQQRYDDMIVAKLVSLPLIEKLATDVAIMERFADNVTNAFKPEPPEAEEPSLPPSLESALGPYVGRPGHGQRGWNI